MANVYPFYSINEVLKPVGNRVHHNNSACPPGRDIPQSERRAGTGGMVRGDARSPFRP